MVLPGTTSHFVVPGKTITIPQELTFPAVPKTSRFQVNPYTESKTSDKMTRVKGNRLEVARKPTQNLAPCAVPKTSRFGIATSKRKD
jgi:hypothetical protein